MSDIRVCAYCKHMNNDITEKPCLHCVANLGAFEFDMSLHDSRVRAYAIDEFRDSIGKLISYSYKTLSYSDVERVAELLKEHKNEL